MSAVIRPVYPAYRPMLMEDVKVVMEIEKRAYPHSWTSGIFRDCLRAGYTGIIAESGGVIIGYAMMSIAVGEAHLLNLCIDPREQSRGCGRRLLTYLVQLARDKRADTLFLEVRCSNQAAQQLYLSEGFNELGIRPNYYPNGLRREDALLFALDLSN